MLSNCMMSKTLAITVQLIVLPLRGSHWYIKYLTEKIYNDNNNVLPFWNQGSMQTFSKHYFKYKTVSIMFRKTLQERILPILKFSQYNGKNNVFHFLTSKSFFVTLKYSGDSLGIFLKQTLVECSEEHSKNITSWLLDFVKKSTFISINLCTFNTKTTFHRKPFNKIFSFTWTKHCNAEGPLNEYSQNISCRLGGGFPLKTLPPYTDRFSSEMLFQIKKLIN